jgi:hypothetical protein
VWRNGDGYGDGYVGVVTAPSREGVTVLSDVTLLPV